MSVTHTSEATVNTKTARPAFVSHDSQRVINVEIVIQGAHNPRQSLFKMIKLDEQTSEGNISVQPMMTQKKVPRIPELQSLELEAQKQYLTKLRNQREKIEQLYKDYDKAIIKIRQQEHQLDVQKNAIITLNSQVEEFEKQGDVLKENEVLRVDHQKNLREIKQLKLKIQHLSMNRSKGAQQIKQFFMEQVQTIELENSQLKQTNQQLQLKVAELERAISRKDSQLQNLKHIEESLRKQISNSTKYVKSKNDEFQLILKQRDQETDKLKDTIEKLESAASEQSIFIELEREKSQQIQMQFNGAYAQLKKQSLRIQKQLQRRLSQNKQLNQALQNTKLKLEQAECTVRRLQNQIEILRCRQEDRSNMINLHAREAERKQSGEKAMLSKQITDLRRAYSSLQLKYEKLKAINKNRMTKEYLQKQIQHYEREQIDRLEDILQF